MSKGTLRRKQVPYHPGSKGPAVPQFWLTVAVRVTVSWRAISCPNPLRVLRRRLINDTHGPLEVPGSAIPYA